MKWVKWLFLSVSLLFYIMPVYAQHEHHESDMQETMSEVKHEMDMPSTILLTVPMQRDSSGTSWLPDTSPVHAFHGKYGAWGTMIHGSIFLRYTNQDIANSGERGASKFDAPNWFMIMGQRAISSNAQIALRSMISLDRITEGGDGYPLLFQTGESWEGKPLIDRQHPHDVFSELSATYSHSLLGKDAGFFIYFGLPGEPALGPPAFMHRPSAQNNPDAPLGHHWQDSTHITFGVATAGLQYKQFKLDGSIFTGREPDENRFDIDKPRFDSYSARISMNPTKRIALQLSRGFIKSPESLEPDVDLWRTTASIIYDYPINMKSNWSTSFVWGMNRSVIKDGHDESSPNSFLAESNLQLNKWSLYTRIEMVKKPAHDLGLTDFEDRLFLINAFALGLTKNIITLNKVSLALGVQSTIYGIENDLQAFYGTRPFSLEIFIGLMPDL